MLNRIEAGRVTETRLMEMVFPEQTNHDGTLFGGQALALDAQRHPTEAPPLQLPSTRTSVSRPEQA